MNVTPLILVKNDEYFLPYTLKSILGLFKRVIIYDVNSKDRTRDIIRWYKSIEKAEVIVSYLPECSPIVQGKFRNSMIPEAESDIVFILDGDEVVRPEDAPYINYFGQQLLKEYEKDNKVKYGVFRRIELSSDLTHKYNVERFHHRLYHRTAYWRGTHPGEHPVFEQNKESEFQIPSIRIVHFHNTLRSSCESESLGRLERKNQHTYHPGDLVPFNLLKEVPLLRKPVENFPVSPALKRLQDAICKS